MGSDYSTRLAVPIGEDGYRLTDIERRFIDAYFQFNFDLLATMRYIGKADPFGKRNHAISDGRRILTRPEVMQAVAERFESEMMGERELLYRLTVQGRNTHANYLSVDEQGNPKIDLGRMVEEGYGHLVKAIVPTRYGLRIEFMDSQKALELLGKHYKLFTDKVEQSGQVTVKVVYAEDVGQDMADE